MIGPITSLPGEKGGKREKNRRVLDVANVFDQKDGIPSHFSPVAVLERVTSHEP